MHITCPLSSSVTYKIMSTDTNYVTINYLFSYCNPSQILSDFASRSLRATTLQFMIHFPSLNNGTSSIFSTLYPKIW